MRVSFELNGEAKTVEVDGDWPLLWVLRDVLDLKGTKFGCGKAACGACTLHVNGEAVRSCSFPVKLAEGQSITTIEGLGRADALHPVQQAWIEHVVPQCGYCQPGFMMATAALLRKIPRPTDDDIDANILNLCRCGTYHRMRKAIHRAAELGLARRPAAASDGAAGSPAGSTAAAPEQPQPAPGAQPEGTVHE